MSRIQAHALLSRHEGLHWSPRKAQNPREPEVTIGRVGSERDGSLTLTDGLSITPLRQIKAAQKHISLGLGVIQGDCLLRPLVSLIESLRAGARLRKYRFEEVGEPDSRVRLGILWVQFDSLLPHFPRFWKPLSRLRVEVLPPAQIIVIGFEVVGAPKALEPCPVPQNQLEAHRGYDSPHELVLHRKDVTQRTVVALGPQFRAAGRIR